MDAKFAFLQPWQGAIRACKSLHDRLRVEDSREFRASQLPVHASIRCWPALPKGYELLAGRCWIPVPFPADAALRGDRERLRRIREALELFNLLAVVSRPAFLHLLAEFVVVADTFDDLFTPDFLFVHPVWECYLVGTLSSEDVVAKDGDTTWGELLGCPEDPVQYSAEFRAAMEKLEGMRRELMGVLCAFVGRQAVAEWGHPSNVIEWTAEHVAIPTKGTQRSRTLLSTTDTFLREIDAILKTEVPPVVQLCTVSDAAAMVKMWEQLHVNTTPLAVETMQPRFAAPGGMYLTAALSRMNLSTLRLNLDEVVDPMASGEASASAGYFLSTLVCGRSLSEGSTEELCVPSLQRLGLINNLGVTFARDSAAGPAGICSALVESSSIHTLTLNLGTLGDRIWWLNQVRWGWLAYALWSSASKTSIEVAKLTNIHLSTATVASVATSLTNCYPPLTLEQNPAESSGYGFIDIQEGTKIRPCGVEDSDSSSIVVSRYCRCRARYDPAESGDQAEVVVPGYGVCTLQLEDGVNTYVPGQNVNGSCSLQTLTMEFFEVENPTLIPSLLSLIGTNLRSLRMGLFWTGRRRSILLDEVAAACPHLEELYLTGFDVAVSNGKELQSWGLKKLVIQSSDEVVGLSQCLSDLDCRMSRELEELEIIIPRSNQIGATYVDALISHSGDYIAVMQEKLPLASKTAMISVVDSAANGVKPVHRLNETIMGLTFAFAATPKDRTVRIMHSH
ncbi:hypothetical protein PHYPSEUDO_015485 [Phytophthora pseudosyringae]|uniref:Uncharacterized protein n=1 Tax=Phytophthora pseudosyringae TaxID=221518 RepID=A0A8T1VYU2_9STRA|nr:hypothetical protein PHYPSEUDO_015485 [Phytophthora pseudosyringae]